jgi:hypothetical protein
MTRQDPPARCLQSKVLPWQGRGQSDPGREQLAASQPSSSKKAIQASSQGSHSASQPAKPAKVRIVIQPHFSAKRVK